MSGPDHNPWLAANAGESPADARQASKGGADSIEPPSGAPNVAWQTRAAAPGEYEAALAEALQTLFERDVSELADLVAGLNELGVQHLDGGAWTVHNYPPAMHVLAAPNEAGGERER